MIIDKGFRHTIAKIVLEDNPNDKNALRILKEPEEKIIKTTNFKFKVINKTRTIGGEK